VATSIVSSWPRVARHPTGTNDPLRSVERIGSSRSTHSQHSLL